MPRVKRIVLVGGYPQDVFVVRDILRSLGVPFELVYYENEAEINRAKGTILGAILLRWSHREESREDLALRLKNMISPRPKMASFEGGLRAQ